MTSFFIRRESAPEPVQTPVPSQSPRDPQLELRVVGRPSSLDDLRMTARFVSPEPVYLCFLDGRPLGYLRVGIGRYTIDFAHFKFLEEDGSAPSHLDPSKLTDEFKLVTEFEWEFNGRDFLSVSLNGRESVDQNIYQEITLGTRVMYRETPDSRFRSTSGEVILPALK